MTLGDLFELMHEAGYPIDANNDYELLTPEGTPITGITVDPKEGLIYVSDEGEGVTVI